MNTEHSLLSFHSKDGQKTAWISHGVRYSFAQMLADISAKRAQIKAMKLRGAYALEGFAPRELWLWILAMWHENLSVLPLPPKLPEWDQRVLPLQGILRAREHGVEHLPLGLGPASGPSDAQLFILTSGSTGRPKAIAHSVNGLCLSALGSLRFYRFHAGDSWLLSLDPAHIGGLQIALRCWLGRGICLDAGEPKDVAIGLKEAPDFLSLVPTQLQRLLEDPAAVQALQKPRAILVGGAGTRQPLIERSRALGLPLSVTYGSSETASQLSAFPPGCFPNEAGAVGQLLPHWELKEEGSELLVKGPALFKGSWAAGIWTPRVDRDGFYPLQDHGRWDGHELFIEGRRDDIFQVGGENLAPREILEPLQQKALVADAVILAKEDGLFGKVPLLVIKSPQRPDLDAILGQLAASVPPIKRPREIWWHESADVTKPSRALYENWIKDARNLQRLWIYE